MKTMLPLSFALFAGAAQAHESLVPHHHPHGISALPGLESIGIAALLLALGLIAYFRFGRG
ncbi:MAG TPA: hypothetical protein VG475_13665 [Pseudolabrys sp.]|jgi:hypothetical protein|nr:hypothetical protein [Pseudolabrys sp.]